MYIYKYVSIIYMICIYTHIYIHIAYKHIFYIYIHLYTYTCILPIYGNNVNICAYIYI